MPRPRREIVYFMRIRNKADRKKKIQGNIQNGKIIFPDEGEMLIQDIIPGKYYDCLVKEHSKVAFARDMKEVDVNYKNLEE